MGLLTRDIALDLGTASTRIYNAHGGIAVDVPTAVAVNTTTGRILAIGAEAGRMYGRTPAHVKVVRPLRAGNIDDFEVAERMLRHLLMLAGRGRGPARTQAVVCAPSDTTGVGRRAVLDACRVAGVSRVRLIPKPVAAALGAGLPVQEATGTLVVDVGAGTTEIAVLCLGGVVAARSVPVSGDVLDEAIRTRLRKRLQVDVGRHTAERLKTGLAAADAAGRTLTVRGRDTSTGMPVTLAVEADEVRAALRDPLERIAAEVVAVLDRCPPELSRDLLGRGVTLTGEGARLDGLEELLRRATGTPVHIASEPGTAAVRGAGRCAEDPSLANLLEAVSR
ncbi:rod shape-determining protein [Streptacidiphilus sp. ASG 303]|uniref:rod shape-determining protein n=1 Tax=Streptacidiphilus sp. ASG 303 TaxID=2896847 RepID=UPI001E34B72A|nr:rod shape-determining protein [Streptacidiphilus sp. ASG 303]MCD0482557.1 rod shape-determining protein [Streptacidiphilus sp. ASG 303]